MKILLSVFVLFVSLTSAQAMDSATELRPALMSLTDSFLNASPVTPRAREDRQRSKRVRSASISPARSPVRYSSPTPISSFVPVLKKPKGPPKLVKKLRIRLESNFPRISENTVLQGAVVLGTGEHGSVYKTTQPGQEDFLIKKFETNNFMLVEKEFIRQNKAANVGVAPQLQVIDGQKEEIVFLADSIGLDTEVEAREVGQPALQTCGNFAFAMEYLQNSATLKYFVENPKLLHLNAGTQVTILDRVYQLTLEALETLHKEARLTHNDMSLENVLVVMDSDSLESIQKVLLIDFGSLDDDSGHAEFHAQESLSVSNEDRDIISLALMTLTISGMYEPYSKSTRLTLNEVVQKIEDQSKSWNGNFFSHLLRRLKTIQTLSGFNSL